MPEHTMVAYTAVYSDRDAALADLKALDQLHEAAEELAAGEAGLIVIGEPTIEKAFDEAVTHAVKVGKHAIDATADELIAALKE